MEALRVGIKVRLKKMITGCEDYYNYTSTVTDITDREVYLSLMPHQTKGKLNCSIIVFWEYFKIMNDQLEFDFNA